MLMKKAFTVLLAILLLCSTAVFAKAGAINDLDKASPYAKDYVQALVENGILTGDENGNVNPQKTLTRGEAVVLIVRTLATFGIHAGSLPSTATFKDVPVGSWAFPYVETAYMAGIVKGVSDDTFDLGAACTREQMAALFVRAFDATGLNTDGSVGNITTVDGLSDASEISAWAKGSVLNALKSGLMKGTGVNTFSPRASAPKEQAAVIIDRYLGTMLGVMYNPPASTPVTTETGGPAIIFNGDVMALSHAPLVENGAVLLPADFFYRYFGPSQSGVAVVPSEITCIDLAWGYNHLTSGYGNYFNTLWFKAGEKTAYKDGSAQQIPFDDPAGYAANALPLQTAPVLRDGVLYLPLADICALTEAQYKYDTTSNTATIATDEVAQFPQLRAALNDDYNTRSTGYRRDILATGTFTQTVTGGSPQPDAQIQLGYNLFTRSNVLAGQTRLQYLLQTGGGAPQNLTYEKISAPSLGMNYITDSKAGAWLVTSRQYLNDVSALTGLDPLAAGKNVGITTVGENLVWNYKDLPVERAGTVDLNGREAVKYVMRLDGDNIMKVFNKNISWNFFKNIFNKGYTYEIDFFVIGQSLVRQEYHFSGQGSEVHPADQVTVTMDLAIDYQNQGKQMPVALPNGIVIEPGV